MLIVEPMNCINCSKASLDVAKVGLFITIWCKAGFPLGGIVRAQRLLFCSRGTKSEQFHFQFHVEISSWYVFQGYKVASLISIASFVLSFFFPHHRIFKTISKHYRILHTTLESMQGESPKTVLISHSPPCYIL